MGGMILHGRVVIKETINLYCILKVDMTHGLLSLIVVLYRARIDVSFKVLLSWVWVPPSIFLQNIFLKRNGARLLIFQNILTSLSSPSLLPRLITLLSLPSFLLPPSFLHPIWVIWQRVSDNPRPITLIYCHTASRRK